MSARQPIPIASLADLVKRALKSYGEGVHTAMPGQIVGYNASLKQASVQPTIDFDVLSAGALAPMKHGVIHNVPVQFPGSSKHVIQWDLAAGDNGLIIFSEASLDAWLSGDGGETDPQDTRRFALSDAFFIPGVNPFGAPGVVGKSGGIDLVNENGTKSEIFLGDDGSIQLNGETHTLVLGDSLATAVASFLVSLNAQLVAAGQPGALALSVPQTTTVKTGG